MASLPKRPKPSSPDDMEIFSRFHTEFTDIDVLKRSFNRLVSDPHNGLVALEIEENTSCNAAEGFTFTDAFCKLAPHEPPNRRIFAFGVIFIRGLSILNEFIKYRVVPEKKSERAALACLLHYLLDEDRRWKLNRSGEVDDDTALTLKLASHFFTNLTPTKSSTIDSTTSNKRSSCSCCQQEAKYGDTSIGNGQVWHGNVDLMLDGAEISVKNLERETVSSGIKISTHEDIHEKHRKYRKCLVQFAAQTIVFSFLQKSRHPEFENFLIPSICVSSNDILFYFYDAEKDVLLGSRKFSMAPHPVLVTILATWLVMNYKVLCSGLADDVPSSNFFAACKDSLEIYQNKLTFGGVGRDPVAHKQLDPLFLVDALGSNEFIGLEQVNPYLL